MVYRSALQLKIIVYTYIAKAEYQKIHVKLKEPTCRHYFQVF